MPRADIKIRQAKAGNKPTKLTDGNGLYLLVNPSDSRLWRYKYRIAGKENLFAIGEYPTVSLQDARAARDDARVLDPYIGNRPMRSVTAHDVLADVDTVRRGGAVRFGLGHPGARRQRLGRRSKLFCSP
ncbi:Arm DNA-binding domain-containing protein [Burkholderia lata]|uniref:Arm DNA-binding domain-containing protein n=1 Tax=Burkholderia lata (strain ATCC 17760 / DSM 23089 / LMG 22485 / NCIMB 9086 / R18194 / 383) TaxID=482957 RepID=UPI0020C6EADF|nr:Arm DNA-binding domain-containing protein [Burkholderia lata]